MLTLHVVLAALLASGGVSPRTRQGLEVDSTILAELAAVAPLALEEGRAASEAFRAQRWQECVDRYERVLVMAPTFTHALRRQGTCYLRLGDRSSAVALCRKALAAAALPENRASLAEALVAHTGNSRASDADRWEAASLARAALDEKPESPPLAAQVGGIALQLGDVPLLRSASERLLHSAPQDPAAHFYTALADVAEHRYDEARQEVLKARAAGLMPAQAERLDRLIERSEPIYLRQGRSALVLVAVWASLFIGLFALGAALSRQTLRSAAQTASSPQALRGGVPGHLRRAYRIVLALCCAYYYLSLPLVLAGVVVVCGGAIYLFFTLGEVPLRIVIILGFIVVVTGWATLKSLWVSIVRPPTPDPGERLTQGTHPRLDAVLAEVASRIGTRPVDAVFLVPGTQVAVFERGGLAKQLAGRSERCLVLGVGVLDGMKQGELKAVLAHEYGHLVNRDTAGGGLALRVRRSIREMALTLRRGGGATWYSPAWWFLYGFERVFLRVSQGASRLQEILADRWAALAFGGGHFARGLRHVIEQSVRFQEQVQATLKEVVEEKRPLANLYHYRAAAAADGEKLAEAVRRALAAQPSPYDSHPCPSDRMAWVASIAAASSSYEDDEAAWNLFTDREAVEREMTAVVRASVARSHGVSIPVSLEAPVASG
jgi:Zn-dependent protease with chaperone function